MKKLALTLALLALPRLTAAQCAVGNVVTTFLGPQFGYTDKLAAPGDETFLGVDVTNTNPAGCAAESICIGAYNYVGEPGEPADHGVKVDPSPTSNVGCALLAPNQTATVIVHVTTNNYGFVTPPFRYHLVYLTKVNGATQATQTKQSFVTLLDPWGNTCAH